MPTDTTATNDGNATPAAAGAAAAPPAGTPPPAATPPPGEEKLGEGGLKALNEERAMRATAEREAKAAKAELDKLKAASMSESEKAIAEAKAEGRKDALAEANARLVRAEVKAAAAGKLADPGDAAALLGDLDRFVTDTGDVDGKALSSAIDELVKTKPYLAPAGRPGALPGGGAKPADGFSMDDFIRRQARS